MSLIPALVSRTSQFFITGNNDTGNSLLPVSLTSVNSLSPLSMKPAINTKLWISPQIFVKMQNDPRRCSGARGKLIHEKDLKTKMSCQTPFNNFILIFLIFTKLLYSCFYLYSSIVKMLNENLSIIPSSVTGRFSLHLCGCRENLLKFTSCVIVL